MSAHRITLHLPGQDPRLVATVDADTPEEAAAITARKMPYLPPAYVLVGDRALAGLLAPARPLPVALVPGLTKGQTLHRQKLRRQRHAERWRQHWIDKADAKRRQA